jgi:hypothetical protein
MSFVFCKSLYIPTEIPFPVFCIGFLSFYLFILFLEFILSLLLFNVEGSMFNIYFILNYLYAFFLFHMVKLCITVDVKISSIIYQLFASLFILVCI